MFEYIVTYSYGQPPAHRGEGGNMHVAASSETEAKAVAEQTFSAYKAAVFQRYTRSYWHVDAVVLQGDVQS